MSWLTTLVRPRIQTTAKRGVSANVWEKCPGCGSLIYESDLAPNMYVCGTCGHHLHWAINDRLAVLMDSEGLAEVPVKMPPDDPLGFRDRKKYSDRLKEARKAGGVPDAFRVVKGAVGGQKCVVAALDYDFMAGTMSRGVGEAVVAGAEAALKNKVPFICITASGGARMQEGVMSLMQMVRATAAITSLKDAGYPFVVLLTDPTTGGVSASFAMQGDVHIAEPGALIGFAGPRVIQQTIGQQLPDGFQKAEYLQEHGMVDLVVARSAQKETITRLLAHLMGGQADGQSVR